MEYWKTTVTILLPLLAKIFSYWGLLRSGGLNTRKYWLVEVRRPQYEKILASRGDWEWLYCDSSRGIRWNIAWALGKSLGLRPRDFPRAQAIFHRIPLLSSQYSYKIVWAQSLSLDILSWSLAWILRFSCVNITVSCSVYSPWYTLGATIGRKGFQWTP